MDAITAAWVNIYTKLVSTGKKTVDDVPEALRESVVAALAAE